MSHPSSSTSFGGVYPKAAHTGLLPCKGECPKESKGLCCAQQSEGPQAPARTRNIPQWLLAGCSCYQGRLSLFWAKDTAQVGEDTWLWDLCYQKVIRGTLGRVNFQMSEGWVGLSYKRFLVEFDTQGLEKQWQRKNGKNQVFKYLQDTDPRTEWDRAGMYRRSAIRCNGRKKTYRKKCGQLGLHFYLI